MITKRKICKEKKAGRKEDDKFLKNEKEKNKNKNLLLSPICRL